MYLNYLAEKRRKELGIERPQVKAQAAVLRWKPRVPTLPSPPVTPKPSDIKTIQPFTHLYNDPLTGDMCSSNPAPIPPDSNPFSVQGLKGGGYPAGSLEFQAANAFVTIAETMNMVNEHSTKKLPHWLRAKSVLVMPRAGVDLNAYYDGRSLRFFYFVDSRIGGAMYTVDSADIVSHETGHSILDCFRPDLWNAAYLEVGAFHEFFGDFCAIMHALSHNEMIQKAIAETGGDMTKSNVITRLAEQFGKAIYALDPNGRNPNYLRSAINDFKYVDPSTLPDSAPDNQLAAEVHNFARIFLGALWDIIVMLYQDMLNEGKTPDRALTSARTIIFKYMMLAIQNAPVNAKFFASVATTLLWADATTGNNKYHNRMFDIFVNRQILTPTVGAQSFTNVKCPNIHNIVKTHNLTQFKLQDKMAMSMAASHHNPLYSVELTVPQDEARLFDKKGNSLYCISCSEDDNIKGAQDLIRHLYNRKHYGPDDKTTWSIQNNKLVRTRTCCCK